jgi:hypothetical protein
MSGDFAALRKFIAKIGGLATGSSAVASRIIDEATGPIRALIDGEFSSASSPYGDAWQPNKDGGEPFAGSDAAGRVSINKIGAKTLRASPAYPMHFHQDGTHSGGRKAQRKLAAGLRRQGAGKGDIKAAKEQLRASGGMHDPARPIVPTDDEGVPNAWEDALRTAATKIMAEAYARPKGGGE